MDEKEKDHKSKEEEKPEKDDVLGRVADLEIPEELPILPLREIVVFPFMIIPLIIARPSSVELINEVVLGNRIIGLFAQKDASVEKPKEKDINNIGSAGLVLKMLKVGDGNLRILVQGLARCRSKSFTQRKPYFKAKVEKISDVFTPSVHMEAMKRSILSSFQEMVEFAPYLPEEAYITAMNIDDPGKLSDFVASNINIEQNDRQNILEIADVEKRLERVNILLGREVELLRLGSKIQSEARSQMDDAQKQYFLRQQLKAIKKELGEEDSAAAEIEDLREKIVQKNLPDEVRARAEEELERLSHINPASAEYSVARTYIDWILILPWQEGSVDELDIDQAGRILDEDHYGLEEVKERILEYLAVRKLKEDMRGPILCFVGPPGTGKTSLGRSIARALGRKFVRMSLGGIHDEAEIRGHRRTYVGALPGRIIQGLREAGTNNPVFMLDEIDKVGKDFRGDPSSALLEVLDPEQNFSFRDNYLDLPFDLSKVMFITTGNILDTVPPPLRDRMETLRLVGYTLDEKVGIAKKFLIPKQLEEHGLSKANLSIATPVLKVIINNYTREAGLRNLERLIARICRKVAIDVIKDKNYKKKVTSDDLDEFLGPRRYYDEVRGKCPMVGMATGLAYTEFGGTITFVEATMMRGKGELTLTGQLGDVMKESAVAALSYLRSNAGRYDIDEELFSKMDIHIHVPAGAVPKDGPSAGITMATALISLFTERPVRCDLAMTGEITLIGRVLPIGGVREKCLAAVAAGIKKVILPKENVSSVEEISDEIKGRLEFVFVENVDEVFKEVLLPARVSDDGRKKKARREREEKVAS